MKLKRNKKKTLIIALVMILVIISIIAVIIYQTKQGETYSSAKQAKLQTYDKVNDGEEEVRDSKTNAVISGLEFDAFFLEDTDGDGEAEGVNSCTKLYII